MLFGEWQIIDERCCLGVIEFGGDVVGQVLALTKVVVREDGKMHLIFYIFGGVYHFSFFCFI